jgi:hypothetical protein
MTTHTNSQLTTLLCTDSRFIICLLSVNGKETESNNGRIFPSEWSVRKEQEPRASDNLAQEVAQVLGWVTDICHPELGAWSLELGAWSLGFWSLGFWTWDFGLGILDLGFWTWDFGLGILAESFKTPLNTKH